MLGRHTFEQSWSEHGAQNRQREAFGIAAKQDVCPAT